MSSSENPERGTIIPARQARQGVTGHNVRLVLGVSLAAVGVNRCARRGLCNQRSVKVPWRFYARRHNAPVDTTRVREADNHHALLIPFAASFWLKLRTDLVRGRPGTCTCIVALPQSIRRARACRSRHIKSKESDGHGSVFE